MKPGWIAALVLGLVLIFGALGYGAWTWQQTGALPELGLLRPASSREARVLAEPAADADSGTVALSPSRAGFVLADGTVLPANFAALNLMVPGIVAEVLVSEGDRVEAGQVLARLQSSREVIAVAQAQSLVDAAAALVAEYSAGARAEEIAVAEAAVAEAQAQLDLLIEGAHPQDIAALDAALAGAQAAYALVAAGANPEELIAAGADLAAAQGAVTRAQRAYDAISWRADVGATLEAATLDTATIELQAAQARYDVLAAGADPNLLAQAAADVAQAQALRDRIAAPVTEAQIAAAEAAVLRAAAERDLVAAGMRSELLDGAQANLTGAEAALLQAQYNLAERELVAPFAGVVAAIDLRVGQQVDNLLPAAQLADDSTWMVETSDLTEIGVVDLKVGDPATVIVDALPDMEFDAVITAIRPRGEADLLTGDILYRVTLRLEESDPRLRWNMTAAVTIAEE